eukprot:IDg11611t1
MLTLVVLCAITTSSKLVLVTAGYNSTDIKSMVEVNKTSICPMSFTNGFSIRCGGSEVMSPVSFYLGA